MDPLTALGLGSNVIQIIDFGVQLAELTSDVIRSGDIYDHHVLNRIYLDLRDLVNGLSQTECNDSDVHLASAEKSTQALINLARECKIEAEAIISRLEGFRPRETLSGKISRRAALKSASLAIWNKSEIENMVLRLDNYRTELGLRMLDVINARSIKQGTSIVEILSLTQNINSSVQTVAALLKNRDGSVDTILSDTQRPRANRFTDTLSISYQDRESALIMQGANDIPKHHAATTEIPFAKVAQKILDGLWFAFINSREEMVENPFGKTFNWISDGQDIENTEWDDFPSWLRNSTGCYWINGKAGSGKSTLMKYIASHPMLGQHLQAWAGDDDLLKGSFFFWRTGMDVLQKSQEGLLRSLLYQVLDKRRDLITVCFPRLCRTLTRTEFYQEELNISFDELKMAFSLLTKYPLPQTKVFLLIDGLDEYQGDHRNLVDLLSQAIESPVMKVLVSSRPIPLLFQAFNKCPGLEIHNLTISDIRHYTEEKLGSDHALSIMNRLEPGISSQLIDTIVSKASGVFLWVKIVVMDLLDGLADHDSLETLLRNVDKLPTNLEQLYDYMFTSMTPSHRKEASRMMRLLMRSQEVQFDYPMTALQLVFAQMRENVGSEEIPQKFLSVDEEKDHCELVEGRLRSRCCGLLEVQKSYWGPQDSRRYVGFLHRTVHDYLEQDEIRAQVLAWDSTPTDIDDVLFASCVMEVRQYAHSNKTRDISNTQSQNMQIISRHQKRAPSTGTRILHALAFRPFSQVDSHGMYEAPVKEMTEVFLALPESEHEEVERRALAKALHPSVHMLHVTPSDTSQGFWMYAAVHGTGFANRASSGMGFFDAQCSSLALFNNLIHLSHPVSGSILSRIATGTNQLLTAGVNPNEPCLFFDSIDTANAAEEIKAAVRLSPNRDNTLIPWIFWLSCRKEKSPIIDRDYRLYMRMVVSMIAAGASLQGFLGFTDSRDKMSIYSAVEECMQARPDLSRDALDLNSYEWVRFRDSMSGSSPNEDPKPLRRASRSWKTAFQLIKRKTSDTT